MSPLHLMFFSVPLFVFTTGAVFAQDFPAKPIRILCGTPGGSSDIAARIIGDALAASLGQQVIVDPRPNVLSREILIKSPPDGYNLMLTANSFYLGPLLRSDLHYDPIKDFSPVTLAVVGANVIAAHPSLPVKTLKDLIALAKARPGELNYASGATGAATHLGPELLKSMAQINVTRIPYKGGSVALADLVGGQVHMMFVNLSPSKPYILSGKLRGLAVTSAERSDLFPDIPTAAASGLPDFEHTSKVGIYAPANVPPMIINRLNQQLLKVLRSTDVKKKFEDLGVESVGSSPEQLTVLMKAEMTRMTKVIEEAGIRVK